MSQKIIGRYAELRKLQSAYESDEAEFIAVYGRRRVGKTYLIRSWASQKSDKSCIFFQTSGIHGADISIQLREFRLEIERAFYDHHAGSLLRDPENWVDAFTLLREAIDKMASRKKIIIFLDEFPWMATKKSNLLQSLDYQWNRFLVNNPRIKMIICGSSASWIIEKVLNNKYGLHNRVTRRIHLEPFTLNETYQYVRSRKITLSQSQVLELYMCLGGIPFYLKFIERGLSAVQNINMICFLKQGELFNEFKNLFSSLFENAHEHETIIRLIAEKRNGISRSDIERLYGSKGGRVSVRLKELEDSGFIKSFLPIGRSRGFFYRIVDEYTMFYLKWIEPTLQSALTSEWNDEYWESLSQSSSWKAWSGYAFESICFKHLPQIRYALKIPSGSVASSWKYSGKKGEDFGAQIDLLFERPDNSTTICEIKYCKMPFEITKDIVSNINKKVQVFQKVRKSEKDIFISMITSLRLKKNLYAEDFVSSEVTLDDLFKDATVF